MKPRKTKKESKSPVENWVDVDDLVKPGEIKEIWPGTYVNNSGVALCPPQPIKKAPRTRKKKSA